MNLRMLQRARSVAQRLTYGTLSAPKAAPSYGFFACGSNEHGRLALGDETARDVLCRIGSPVHGEYITQVALTPVHTLLLLSNGDVYACGSNISSQLGVESDKTITPTLVAALAKEKIVHVCASSEASFAVTDDGRVYSWGTGILVGAEPDTARPEPRRLLLPEGVRINRVLCNDYLAVFEDTERNDIYLHTEAHGGSSVLVKLPVGTTLPPPSSLLQAAQFCASRSSAWKNRALTNVFWVHANQVSKSAQSGQYLPTGSFVIRGKRHFLPAPQLVMGACVMFKVSRQSWQKHHRHERQTDADKAAEMRAAIDAAQKKREEEDKKFRERFSHLGFEDEDDEALEEHQVAAPSKAPRSQQQRSKNRRNKKKQEKAAKKHEKQLESSKSSDNALPRGRKQKLRRLQKKQRGKELFEDVRFLTLDLRLCVTRDWCDP
ncbi:MAG: hypothetical protein MHM6MM_000939 [Cercozoa sp. M6MM]